MLSTLHQRFTFVRLPGAHLTGFCPPFPATLTTSALIPPQLTVVWGLLLQTDPEGPTLIGCTARLLQVTISGSSPRRRGALSSAKRTTIISPRAFRSRHCLTHRSST